MDLKTGEAFVEGSGDPAVRVIEIKKSVFADNDIDADNLRSELKEKGVFLLNLMSAPGSGKTTTLIRTIDILRQKIGVAVMEADIDSDVDARKIKEATDKLDWIQIKEYLKET